MRIEYDYGGNLKKRQRRVNRAIRKVNKSIANDDWWLGRFEIKQIDRCWYPFEDGSGAELTVIVEIVDKENNVREVWRIDANAIERNLWYAVNGFIVTNPKVKLERKPGEKDYRNIKADFHGHKAIEELNYFMRRAR